jgi:hypothetical protein
MKIPSLPILAAAVAAGAIFPGAAFAAAGSGPKARIFAEFDKNKNGVIDGDEVAAVRKAFAADPKGQFAAYDKNKDGQLDDAEIATIKPPGAGGKGGAKKAAEAEKKPTTK